MNYSLTGSIVLALTVSAFRPHSHSDLTLKHKYYRMSLYSVYNNALNELRAILITAINYGGVENRWNCMY